MPLGQPFLISGAAGFPSRRRGGPLLVAALLFLTLAGSGGYLVWQKISPGVAVEQAQTAAAGPRVGLTEPIRDDLAVHVQNATRHVSQNIETIRRAQQRMKLVLGALDQNYLSLEQRRLMSAYQLSEQAIVEATAAFEELRVADQQLRK